jgi:hypothetical protein
MNKVNCVYFGDNTQPIRDNAVRALDYARRNQSAHSEKLNCTLEYRHVAIPIAPTDTVDAVVAAWQKLADKKAIEIYRSNLKTAVQRLVNASFDPHLFLFHSTDKLSTYDSGVADENTDPTDPSLVRLVAGLLAALTPDQRQRVDAFLKNTAKPDVT